MVVLLTPWSSKLYIKSRTCLEKVSKCSLLYGLRLHWKEFYSILVECLCEDDGLKDCSIPNVQVIEIWQFSIAIHFYETPFYRTSLLWNHPLVMCLLWTHDGIMTWKLFPHNWPFVWGESTGHWWIPFMKDRQCRALTFFLVLIHTSCFTGDLRFHDTSPWHLN